MTTKTGRKAKSRAGKRADQSLIAILPKQTPEAIERVRDVREAAHDLKARTIKGKPR